MDERRRLLARPQFLPLPSGAGGAATREWIGWRLHGWRGVLAAGLLFVRPGAVIIFALSMLYPVAANLDWFEALFVGVKAAELAIVLQALIRIARRALNTRFKQSLAIAAFAAMFLFDLPFPVVILGAGLLGLAIARVRPQWLAVLATPSTIAAGPRP